MSKNTTIFVSQLIVACPELAGLYRLHLVDQGELLPHVFMGDVTRLVVSTAKQGSNSNWLSRMLGYFEAELLSGNEEVAELLGVSFVENLCGEDEAIQPLLPIMGEMLRKEVKSICGK